MLFLMIFVNKGAYQFNTCTGRTWSKYVHVLDVPEANSAIDEIMEEWWSFQASKYSCSMIGILSILLWLIYQPEQIWLLITYILYSMVHLVLHPQGIALTFLKLDSWSPGEGFYSYYIHQGNYSDKKKENLNKKVKLYAYKKIFFFFLKDRCNSVWVQFNVSYPRIYESCSSIV
jgi:hypothetical protein